MDGSASVSQSERARTQPTRSFANRAATEAHTQSELFEQLLSLNFTVQPPAEKPAARTESSSTSNDDATCDCQEKDAAPVEEEHDEELSQSTLATLAPALAIEKQQSLEPESKGAEDTKPLNSTAEAKLCDLPKVAEDVAKPAVVEAASVDDAVVQVDASEASTELPVAASTEDTTRPTETGVSDDGDLIRRRGKAKDNDDPKAAAGLPVEQVVEPKTKAKEDTKSDPSQSVHNQTAVQNAVAETNGQADDEQRGQRRDKWFERDASSATQAPGEGIEDASAVRLPVDVPKPSSIAVASDSQATSAATADASQPSADSTLTIPVTPPVVPTALPASLAAASQVVSSATTSSSATTGAETNQLGPAAPTRSVGTQAAKADSKDKSEATQLSQQERVRVIQRIARSFNRISAEGGTINLRLHPEQLGSVTVQVKLEGRSMAARLTTETTAAREAIMADLPALRQRLADQGFDVTKFQVDVAGNSADTTFAQTNGDSQSRQYENRSSGSQTDYRRLAANRESRMAFATRAPLTTATTITGAGIDLQV